MRQEKDSLGEVSVPDGKLWGAQTQRAYDNFKIGSEFFPAEFIRAHALVKQAAARANMALGVLDQRLGEAIAQATEEVIVGKWDHQFPLVIWQSGSATQFNMNVNEVIANRAIQLLGGQIGTKSPVHPNDHVNMGQSTNDTIPTALHIAAVVAIKEKLLPAVELLYQAFIEKAEQFRTIIKIGRTHLQDATPLTLGQEFSGYAAQLDQAMETIGHSLSHLYELPIGGTAVGTGVNTKKGFDHQAVAEIVRITNQPFVVCRNKFAGLAAHDAVVATSGALKTLAAALMKIANDIRWLASGPRSGLGELILPANEPGSSIMPGKMNPTQCEMAMMVACQVYGNDTVIGMAGAMGNLELNVFKPVIVYNLLQSIRLLTDASISFCDKAIKAIAPNHKRIAEQLNRSLMLVTCLNSKIGYDKAAQIAINAWHSDLTLKQSALDLGYLTAEQFDTWVRPEHMIGPDE